MTDLRRPYSERTYDALGRLASDTTLLSGNVTPASFALPAGAPTSTTTYTYDVRDRPIQVQDPAGYLTTASYDADGHTTSLTQQVWKGTESGYATLSSGFTSVTQYAAYDAAGRAVQNVDERGGITRAQYDLLGNLVSETDERGVVTRGYSYTPDGLLEGLYEPDMNPATPATSFNPANPSGFFKTRSFVYGARPYATDEYRAVMNTPAGAVGSARHQYTYDFAGRRLTQTRPDGAVISETYTGRGLSKTRTDELGFRTTFDYDSAGRLTQRQNHARTTGQGAAWDTQAGLGAGLAQQLTYDPAGHVTRRVENGLVTDFAVGSLGQVLAATRPAVSGTPAPRKLLTYRLDGARTAETTYGYAGDLASRAASVNTSSSFPTVTAGNVSVYDLDARGLTVSEKAAGHFGGLSNAWDSTITSTYDGRGRRAQRSFAGSPQVYDPMRTLTGLDTASPNHQSVWKYDRAGALESAYDTLPDGSNQQNVYTYTYTPTGRPLTETVAVDIRRQSRDAASRLWTQGGSAGVLLAGTRSTTTLSYNERDLPADAQLSLATPEKTASTGAQFSSYGPARTQTTAMTYFGSGHRQDTRQGGVSVKQTLTLDQLGRETRVRDLQSGFGDVYVDTSYSADGTVRRDVRDQVGALKYTDIQTPTLGGRPYYTYNSRTLADGNAANDENTTVYSRSGSPLVGLPHVVTGRGAVSYGYDAYGALASDVRAGVTTTYTTSPAGALQAVSAGAQGESYALDGRGRRLGTTGGSLDGFQTRYDVDGRISALSAVSGTSARYNDFRRDPFGRAVVVGRGGFNEVAGGGYQLRRDNASTVRMLGVPLAVDRSTEARDDVGTPVNVYVRASEDQGYSFADGSLDTFDWGMLTSFSAGAGVSTLSAPVRALSERLRIDPLDIRLPQDVGPKVDPGNVRPEWNVPPESVRKVGPQAVASQAVASQPLGAPRSALPGGLAPLAPVDVRGGSALPVGRPDPEGVRLEGGRVRALGIIVSPVEPYEPDPGSLYEMQDQDTFSQSESTEWTTSVDYGGLESVEDLREGYTVTYGDAGLYEAETMGTVVDASYVEPTYASQVNADVQNNVTSIFASRGLTYVPDSDINSGELLATVTSNLDAAQGDGASILVGDVTGANTATAYNNGEETGLTVAVGTGPSNYGTPYAFMSDESYREIETMPAPLPEYQPTMLLADASHMRETNGAVSDSRASQVSFRSVVSSVIGADDLVTAFTFRNPDGSQASLGQWVTAVGFTAANITPVTKAASVAVKSARVAKLAGAIGRLCSFTADTPVWTRRGLVAIAAVGIGEPVLAYNEATEANGYYPVTAVHAHIDPEVTYLGVKDAGELEIIRTTPNHPFYVTERSDNAARPKPVGHEDLNSNWVGAGHLKVGDKIKQADGTKGVVTNVITVQQTQEMFNLTVSEAHTFYVGTNGWLVHNGCDDAVKTVKTAWGWTGTPSYKAAQKAVASANHRATFETIGGVVPTQAEAEALAQSVGGKLVRAELGHPTRGVSTHNLDHVLVQLPGGRFVTINVTKVINPYGSR